MKKNVRLTITGIQSGFGPEDRTEQITTAEYYNNKGRQYLFYTEYTEEGTAVRCRLAIEPGRVELKKTGNGESVLIFSKRGMQRCSYQSPAGPLELLSDTHRIEILSDEDCLTVYLEYSLFLHGEPVSDYRLTIKAQALMYA